jgi:hypothetical protein
VNAIGVAPVIKVDADAASRRSIQVKIGGVTVLSRLRKIAVGAATVAAFSTLILTGSADAAPSIRITPNISDGAASCNANFCLWTDADFKNGATPTADDVKNGIADTSMGTDGSINDLGQLENQSTLGHEKVGMPNRASSMVNGTTDDWCIYSDKNFFGDSAFVAHNTTVSNFQSDEHFAAFNDRVRSVKRLGPGGKC